MAEALEDFDRACELSQGDHDIFRCRIRVMIEMGMFERALRDLSISVLVILPVLCLYLYLSFPVPVIMLAWFRRRMYSYPEGFRAYVIVRSCRIRQ